MSYSAAQLDALNRLSRQIDLLEEACDALNALLSRCHQWTGRTFIIPRVRHEDEGRPVTDIAVTETPASDVMAALMASLTDWYGVPGYSTKHVHRTPGAVVVHTDEPARLLAAIEHCNELKARMLSIIPELGNRNDRFELIHRRHPMLIQLQLTRRLTALLCPPDIQSITFSWGYKTEIRKLTVEQACAVLERYRAMNPARYDDGIPWTVRIDQDMARLRSLPPTTPLRHRRPLNVRPLANVRFRLTDEQRRDRDKARDRGERVNQPTVLREAHTPLIVINPREPVRIGALPCYDANQRAGRKARSGGLTDPERLVPYAPIYALSAQSGSRN